MKPACLLGIDPGASGAAAIIYPATGTIDVIRFSQLTEPEIAARIRDIALTHNASATVEKVGARPGQGVASMCTFGENIGFIRGVLTTAQVPFTYVTPAVWQRAMGVPSMQAANRTKAEHKKALRQHAQRLFPQLTVLADTADALLIMAFAKQNLEKAATNFDVALWAIREL